MTQWRVVPSTDTPDEPGQNGDAVEVPAPPRGPYTSDLTVERLRTHIGAAAGKDGQVSTDDAPAFEEASDEGGADAEEHPSSSQASPDESAPSEDSPADDLGQGPRSRPGGFGIWRAAGVVITAAGLLLLCFFVYMYGFTTVVGNRNQHQLTASLTGVPKALYGLVEGRSTPQGHAVALLEIPSLGLRQVVVEGTSAADLTKGPGLEPGTALPGDAGTSVIAGRRVTYGGPFSAINKLEPGSTIRVVDGDGAFRYKVARSSVVNSGNFTFGPTRANQLLLVTSNSSFIPAGNLLVQAQLVGKPSPLSPRQGGVRSVHLALAGDSSAGILTILWALAFVLVALGTLLAVRRWGRAAVVYRLAVPVLLACGFLACESLARWLPVTL